VNRSGREEDLYFTDGIHEEILGRLSAMGGVRVIARPSVMRFRDSVQAAPDIATALGVRYLLGAGLMRARDKVRINVQLMDARADQVRWAETYERDLTMENLLSVQAEIAYRVATELEAVLTPEEKARIRAPLTENLEAYDLYLVGRHRWVTRSSEMLRRAIVFYGAAIEKDPDFALAWAGLADAWTALPFYEPMSALEAYTRARDAARKALELDDGLAEVHTALGGQAFYYEWDWDQAEAHLLRALELNPNYAQAHLWLSLVHSIRGRLDQAIASIGAGIRLNPLGNNYHGHLAQYLFNAGRLDEALAVFRTLEEFDPPIPTDLLSMSFFLNHQGSEEEASRVIRRWGQAVRYPRAERLPLVLRAFQAPELTKEALAVLEDLRRTTGLQAGFLACFYLNLHDSAEALEVLGEAIAQRHTMVPFLGMTRYFPRLSQHPELVAALQGAGIPIR
jgi:TolB-like protein/Tfp pilus assembly protein PilF